MRDPFEPANITKVRAEVTQEQKIQALVLMQKWVRGHQARKLVKRYRDVNFKQMRKFRRMVSVAYGRMRTKLLKQTVQILQEAGNLHADQNYQVWRQFQEHCAIMVQARWRSYRQRFVHIKEFNEKIWLCKKLRLTNALVRGFKTRLLLHPDGYQKSLSQIRMEIRKSTEGKALIIDVNDKLTLKNLMKRRRQKVVELIRQFDKSFNQTGIIKTLLQARRKQSGIVFPEKKSKKAPPLKTPNEVISSAPILWPSEVTVKTEEKPLSFWPS